jgi:2-amino-4-hydroxy-6-hydroxymethyldihydropteridine diphosphokinase
LGTETTIDCDRQAVHHAFVAFGANLGDPPEQIRSAWKSLAREPIIDAVALSHLYRNAPVGGPSDQPDYVNAVGYVRTAMSARELLDECLAMEQRFGRERGAHWGPRTLDVDLILFDDEQCSEPGLILPHPRLRERLFVLVPLSDIAPAGMKIPPDGKTLDEIVLALVSDASHELDRWRRCRVG